MTFKFAATAASLALAIGAFAACGDGSDDDSGDAATPTTAGGEARIPADFGPAPKFGNNVELVSPAHASRVKQAETRTTDPIRPGGLCAEVNFDDPVENLQWFRMVLDAEEVTARLTVKVDSGNPPKGATLCWAPPEGLKVGKHTAALSVGPFGGDPIQVIGWAFEVTD